MRVDRSPGPPEEQDIVTVSVTARRVLSAADYLDLTGLAIDTDTIDAVVMVSRATRAPKKRPHRIDCQRVIVSANVRVRGDLGFGESLLPDREAYDLSAGVVMPVCGNLKLIGDVA